MQAHDRLHLSHSHFPLHTQVGVLNVHSSPGNVFRHAFWKVPSIVSLQSTCTRALTFENVRQERQCCRSAARGSDCPGAAFEHWETLCIPLQYVFLLHVYSPQRDLAWDSVSLARQHAVLFGKCLFTTTWLAARGKDGPKGLHSELKSDIHHVAILFCLLCWEVMSITLPYFLFPLLNVSYNIVGPSCARIISTWQKRPIYIRLSRCLWRRKPYHKWMSITFLYVLSYLVIVLFLICFHNRCPVRRKLYRIYHNVYRIYHNVYRIYHNVYHAAIRFLMLDWGVFCFILPPYFPSLFFLPVYFLCNFSPCLFSLPRSHWCSCCWSVFADGGSGRRPVGATLWCVYVCMCICV